MIGGPEWQPTGFVRVVHCAVAGRVRFRVGSLKRSPALKQQLEQALAGRAGVLSVSASSLTGTVLVSFAAPMDHATLAAAISAAAAASWHAASAAGAGRPAPSAVTRTRTVRRTKAAPERSQAKPLAQARAQPKPKAGADRRGADAPIAAPTWHALHITDVIALTSTCPQQGLSSTEAVQRLQRFGPNSLPHPPRRSRFAILIEQVATLPVALLAASAVISVATGGAIDAVVILGVVAANAVIGYATESEAVRTIEALSTPVQVSARVVRDGREQEVAVDRVVVGDIQILEPGSYVAADARLVDTRDLTADESPLTGESLPVRKGADLICGADTPLSERTNMVYRGTALTGGNGRAVVIATGSETEIGRIQSLIGAAEPPPTPMEVQLGRLSTQLAWLSGGICGVLFAVGLVRGYGLLPMLKTAISLAVAAVPEGLPTIATTTLALGIRDMRRRKVLLRRFHAVETLGAVQVICFDKTGTLTLNRMSVAALACDGRMLRVVNGGLQDEETTDVPAVGDALTQILRVAVLCNDTEIGISGGTVHLKGSPTEAALVRLALDLGLDVADVRRCHPLTAATYRSEQRSFMGTHHAIEAGEGLLAVKGSPSAVLAMCRWQLQGGTPVPLTDADRQEIERANDRLAGEALRVLGFASKLCSAADAGAEDGLTWLGLIGMADELRPGMRALMQTFHGAGIATIMITGDQSATAYAVAKALRLSTSGQVEILDAVRLEDLPPDVLTALAQRAHVFSRVTPSHKLQIVQALQRANLVVAMTGDGINDGPALRAANIGIAMGRSGTEVARDVADVVLADDDPKSIATAIARGRVIFANVRKALRFLLATNMTEIMVAGLGTSAGLGSPLTPMQLLWINLLSDVVPALGLALEPGDEAVMQEPPHPAGEAILRQQDLRTIAIEGAVIGSGALAACVYGNLRYGPTAKTSTMTFMSLITAQLLHAVSCRSDRRVVFGSGTLAPNPVLRSALIGSFALQALGFLVPPLRRLLGLVPLAPRDWAVTAAAGVAPLLLNELAKGATVPLPVTKAKP
ncbi:MAG: HAD-IC family P-type ATPase [Defluviicoccus sp.]|nr:HAD-IC family P-type ATPase [Defluviicoccus sp.]